MIKTGLEIVEMIAKGNIPKVIKIIEEDKKFYWDKIQGDYFDGTTKNAMLGILTYINDEFEIIEEPKVWKPKENEQYLFIKEGSVWWDFWGNRSSDNFYYEIGNFFRTEEEAQKALEKIKIYTQLKRYAEEHNIEEIDFEKEKGVYHFGYDFRDKMVKIYTSFNVKNMNNVYFTSRGICERAIKEIGEDNIKKLFEE